MRQVVEVPRLGVTADAVVIVEWVVQVGDTVRAGAPLVRVETDKIETEVPAPSNGVLVERLVAEGDEVDVGAPLCTIDSSES